MAPKHSFKLLPSYSYEASIRRRSLILAVVFILSTLLGAFPTQSVLASAAPGPIAVRLPSGKEVPLEKSASPSEQRPQANALSSAPLSANPAAPLPSHDFSNGITIEPITAYNLIVDSNVLSPSSYGPSAATLGAKFCNTTGSTLYNIRANIGNYDAKTPGTYPTRLASTVENTDLKQAAYTDLDAVPATPTAGSAIYKLKHQSGSVSVAADASRYIAQLNAGECRTEYWLITYPRKAYMADKSAVSVTGSIKPDDDLWLPYHFWSSVGGNYSYYKSAVTMRNEISAMANKIWPNGDNKVPQQYLDAIQQAFGWETIAPNAGGVAYPGQTVTSQGIWYDLGNVGAGFDNNGDVVPDHNAWLQPIGDAAAYDPGCFRLVQTYGIVIVKLVGGGELLIPFLDQMYFENIPDNTGVVGLVFYQYAALDGACSAALTPYQEVASGYDNEKFNADFGAGLPPLQSTQTNMTFDKDGAASAGAGGTINYTMNFMLPKTGTNPVMVIGNSMLGTPLVFQETIPAGTIYHSGSAGWLVKGDKNVNLTTTMNTDLNGVILYSHDGDLTFSTTETPVATVTHIQWWLNSSVSSISDTDVYGGIKFSVDVPTTYTPPVVTDTGCIKLGDGNCFAQDTYTTTITGAYQIQGTVFKDDGTGTGGVLGNGIIDGTEAAINSGASAMVSLYYDTNGSGKYDAGDMLLLTSATSSTNPNNYVFSGLRNGTYFVVVDAKNSAIPTGYAATMPTVRTVTINNANQDNINFGFAPALAVQKRLDTTGTITTGDLVQFTLTAANTLPGDGTGGSNCTYQVWADKDTLNPLLADPSPTTGTGNRAWQSTSDIFGRPDGRFGYTVLTNNPNEIGLSGFNIGNMGGTIKKVQLMAYVKEITDTKASDELDLNVYYNSTTNDNNILDNPSNGSQTYTFQILGSDLTVGTLVSNYVVSKTLYDAAVTPTFLPPGGWNWNTFTNNLTEFKAIASKGSGGGTSGDFGIDAVGFVITTDQVCGGSVTVLNPVPLTDKFDPAYLEFVSASPAITSQPDSSTLQWSNVGPLYAGQSKYVTVTFRAKTSGTTTNQSSSNGALFANGAAANSDATACPSDNCASATIAAPANGSISGYVWNDWNNSGWSGTVGYQAPPTDFMIPGATVTLYACKSGTTFLTPATAGYTAASTCTSLGGTWSQVTTAVTGSDGYYRFSSLVPGFYYSVVTPPTIAGATLTQSAEPQQTATGETGATCAGACDNAWLPSAATLAGVNTAVLSQFDNLVTGEQIANANFGYRMVLASGTYFIGDTLYYDWAGDGKQDAMDETIPNVDVALYRDLNSNGIIDPGDPMVATTTTGASGNTLGKYCFGTFDAGGNCASGTLAAGAYIVKVDATDPQFPGNLAAIQPVIQTGDPDQPLVTCTTCDNQAKVTLSTAGVTNIDFGYHLTGSASLGDTVFFDKNGDGVQLGTAEIGLAGVTVNLQVDLNGDGNWVTVATQTTDASGKYRFTNLPNATYQVVVSAADPNLPKDAFGQVAQCTTGMQYTLVVSGGAVTTVTNQAGTVCSSLPNGCKDENLVEKDPFNLDADFGFAPLGAFGDTVYVDINGNGTQDIDEPGIPGVKVHLYTFVDSTSAQYPTGNGRYDPGDAASLVDTGKFLPTDANGHYLFSGLTPGYYAVGITQAENVVLANTYLTGDPNADGVACPVPPAMANPVCDQRDGLHIYAGTNYMGADFGYQPLGVVGDTLWVDSNGNGVRDLNEAGIPNITVKLCADAACNSVVSTTSTNAEGNYSFTGLGNSTYYVVVDTTDTDLTSLVSQGLTQTFEKNQSTTPDNVTAITLTGGTITAINGTACAGSCGMDVDFGYQYSGTSSISGGICLDISADGKCGSTGDVPYANSVVALYKWVDSSTNPGVIDPGEIIQLTTTRTLADGSYAFNKLPTGTYYVYVDSPDAGLNLTTTAAQTVQNNISKTPTSGFVETASQKIVISNAGDTITPVDFGYASSNAYDFGDLPDLYHTTLATDGARHIVPATRDLWLGASVTIDANGVPSAAADTDAAGDDGVDFSSVPASSWVNSGTGAINVTVSGTRSGWLMAWVDYNQNGLFTDTGERIANGAVSAGTVSLPISVPAGTFGKNGDVSLYSRFRLFPSQPIFPGVAYQGEAADGEVEDYVLTWKLAVTKTTSTPTVFPGGKASYTITATNTGNQPVTGVTISDDLSKIGAGFSYDSSVTPTFAENKAARTTTLFNPSGPTNLTWGTWTIQPGGSVAVTFSVLVDTTVSQGITYNNLAAASSDQNGTITFDGTPAGEDVKVVPSVDLYVTKDDAQTAYFAGGTVTYTIKVGNKGPSTATNAAFVDSLAANLDSASWTCTASAGVACPNASGSGSINETITLPMGEVLTYQVTGTVKAAPVGDLVNTATITPAGDVAEKDSSDNSKTDTDSLAALTLVKTPSPVVFTAEGNVISYSYTLTNTGSVTLDRPFSVTDNKAVVTCPATPASLAPKDAITCTASYSITAGDVTAGAVTNTASATALAGALTVPSNTVSVTVNKAALTLTKAGALDMTIVSPTSKADVGDKIVYTFSLTNSGNAPLSGVTVTDAKLDAGSLACTPAAPFSLAVGAKGTCTGTYTLVATDLTNGSVVNTATASSTEGASASANQTVPVPAADLSLIKTVDTATPVLGGQVVFTLTVSNAGPVTATNVTVKDVLPAGLSFVSANPAAEYDSTTGIWTVGSVAQGTPEVLQITAKVTSGTAQTNSAQVQSSDQTDPDSIPGNNSTAEDDDDAVTVTPVVGSISGVVWNDANGNKTREGSETSVFANVTVTLTEAGPDGTFGSADDVTYDEQTTNASGIYTFSNLPPGSFQVHVTDTSSQLSAYTLTTSDPLPVTLSAGQNINNADFGYQAKSYSFSLTKAADVSTLSLPGVVKYTVTLKNTSGNPLTGITISDSLVAPLPAPTGDTGNDQILGVGETWVYTYNYTVIQANIDALASLDNTVTADTAETNPPQTAKVSIPITHTPALTLVKSVTETAYSAVGNVLHYTFNVTNTGNVTVANVSIADALAGISALTCTPPPGSSLAPLSSMACTASYSVTQADLNSGSVTNSATATGSYNSGTVTSNTASKTVNATQTPGLTLDKTTTATQFNGVGNSISYQYQLTNSGNVTLSAPYTVTDDKATVTCPGLPATLVPGASLFCSATYDTTLTDVSAAKVTNQATAHARFGALTIDSNTDQVTVPYIAAGFIQGTVFEDKDANSTQGTGEGGLNLVRIDLFNSTGTLLATKNTDSSGFYQFTGLDAGTYTVVETDLSGYTSTTPNTVSVTILAGQTGTANFGDQVINPALGLTKQAAPATFSAVGNVITYSFDITNAGNVTLTNVSVADALPGLGSLTCTPAVGSPLAPKDSMHCEASYSIVQADLDLGAVNNSAQATALYGSTPVTSPTASVSVTTTNQKPALTLAKQVTETGYATAGNSLHYSYLLTNSGNVTLAGPFTVSDDKTTVTCPATATLAPTSSITCTAIYTIQQSDLDSGSVTNHATAAATFAGKPVSSNPDSVTVNATQTPGLTLVKTAISANYNGSGVALSYEYLLTNSGNVTLSGPFTVGDDKTSVTCPATATLAPTKFITCTASYSTVSGDLSAGSVTNHATAHAVFGGKPVDSNPAQATVPYVPNGVIQGTVFEDKDGNKTQGKGEGGLSPVLVQLLDSTGTPVATKTTDANGFYQFTGLGAGTYTVVQTDLTGYLSTTPNTVSVSMLAGGTGTANFGDQLINAALALVKKGVPTTVSAVGDKITYTFEVTNTGNVALNNVTVADPLPGLSALTCTPASGASLNPGDKMSCSAIYSVTQADLDSGAITNTATASGVPASGTPVSSDPASVTITPTTSKTMTLAKVPSPTSFNRVGQVITYEYTITNTGTVTLSGPFTISDNKIGSAPFACGAASATIAPAGTLTCTATYSITQADLDASAVTNTATATGSGLTSSQTSATVTLLPPGSITGTVFNDADGSGTQGTSENGLSSVKIELYDSTGQTLIKTITTAPGGGYSFTDIPAGDYLLVETDLAGYISTTANTRPVTVPSAGTATVNFGDMQFTQTTSGSSSIHGMVYNDANSSGAQDSGENPLAGNTVQLLNSAGTIIATTQTAADGTYSFTNLPPGTYTVVELDAAGYSSTTLNHVSVTLGLNTNASVNYGDQKAGAVVTDPAVTKFGDPTQAEVGDSVIYTITVGNNGTSDAENVVLTDTKPAFLDVVSVSVSPNPGFTILMAGSSFSINFGTVRPVDFYTVTVVTRVNSLGLPPGGANTVSVRTTSVIDPVVNDRAAANLQILTKVGNPGTTTTLPSTGFAPGVVTILPAQPQADQYMVEQDLALEIPSQAIQTAIVGIPRTKAGWDITWLGSQAGYLDGTAFPTWSGNSVITGHVYLANGLPGPFINLGKLKWGDQVIVHAFGQKYIYEVRSVAEVAPNDTTALRHEDSAWVTLITCKQYDEKTKTYKSRVVVRATLVKVTGEK